LSCAPSRASGFVHRPVSPIAATLFENLCQIISSEISHEAQSYDTRNVTSEDETIVNIEDYRGESPEDTTYYREMVRRYLDFLGSHDRVARDIADLMLNRCVTESEELAIQRGLSVRKSRMARNDSAG
jgi:hypothetical protein